KGRNRATEVARMRFVHFVQKRCEPRTATAVDVVRGGGNRFDCGNAGSEPAHVECALLPPREVNDCGSRKKNFNTPPTRFLPMLPPEKRIEVRSRQPAQVSSRPPLLFVHGGYCDAWCWVPYFLPYFASRGFPSYALSLRGHGESG